MKPLNMILILIHQLGTKADTLVACMKYMSQTLTKNTTAAGITTVTNL